MIAQAWGLLTHPLRAAPLAYLVAWLVGTLLLLTPAATAPGRTTGWWEASFTSMSALCITGLVVVDTATHWTPFGQGVILALIQVGGLGIMTLTTLMVAHLAGRRLSLGQAIIARGETRARSLGDVRGLPLRILAFVIACEAAVAIVLTVTFRPHSGSWGRAIWDGVFHAVSAFNNAGFGLYSANLIDFNADVGIMVPICVAVVVGGLGFPVWLEVGHRWRVRAQERRASRGRAGSEAHAVAARRGDVDRRRPFSLHARITVAGSLLLLAIGYLTFVVWEWGNPGTLGGADLSGKLLGALGGAVFPRTAGFNSIDYAQASQPTIFVNYLLMFVGGGAAGTAGGLKVSTLVILLAVVITEVRGEDHTVVGTRSISSSAQRQALALVVVSLAVVALAALVIMSVSDAPLRSVLFECFSAFGTVGLSMNLTPALPPLALAVLMVLMYLGRVGVLSFVAALALRSHRRRFTVPEEDPLVG